MLDKTGYEKNGMSAATLKYIALLSMLIDHIGAVLLSDGSIIPFSFPLYYTCRMIGRLAFPIFSYFLVEGFLYTKNRGRYMLRLFVFALLSEIPFDLAFFGEVFFFSAQNVLFTFLIAALMMQLLLIADNQYYLYPFIVLGAAALASFLKTDYKWMGVCLAAVLFIFHQSRASAKNRSLFALLRTIFAVILTATQQFAPLAFILLHFYNGRRGKQYKYLFYLFYPLHILLLWAVYTMLQ